VLLFEKRPKFLHRKNALLLGALCSATIICVFEAFGFGFGRGAVPIIAATGGSRAPLFYFEGRLHGNSPDPLVKQGSTTTAGTAARLIQWRNLADVLRRTLRKSRASKDPTLRVSIKCARYGLWDGRSDHERNLTNCWPDKRDSRCESLFIPEPLRRFGARLLRSHQLAQAT
jgi:hypothetical protein